MYYIEINSIEEEEEEEEEEKEEEGTLHSCYPFSWCYAYLASAPHGPELDGFMHTVVGKCVTDCHQHPESFT